MNRDFSDAASSSPSVVEPDRNSPPRLLVWLAATLAAAAGLAWLAGSATPRVRLIAIFPLCLGLCTAYLAMWLMIPLKLKISDGLTAWIVLLAVLAALGSSFQSWQIWRRDLIREHAAVQQQIGAVLKDLPAGQRAQVLRDNARQLTERTSLQEYLSDRLLAFAQRVGRRQVWDAPVPEIIFGGELFLAAAGAYIMVAFGSGSGPWGTPRRPEEGAAV
jgi:hypothetical protein